MTVGRQRDDQHKTRALQSNMQLEPLQFRSDPLTEDLEYNITFVAIFQQDSICHLVLNGKITLQRELTVMGGISFAFQAL